VEGHVYVLINSSFPSLVKIGRTSKTPQARAQELSSTGTPGRFVVAYSVPVDNCIEVEAELHSLFAAQRHTNDREFFELESTVVIDKLIDITNGRRIDEMNTTKRIVDTGIATLYLIRINKRNTYRIGLVNRSKMYLEQAQFKAMVVDLYNHIDPSYFYECEIIESKEFSGIDEDARDQIQNMIDDELARLKVQDKALRDFGKYDARTFIVKADNNSLAVDIYRTTFSLIEPVIKAAVQRSFKKNSIQKNSEDKKTLENKLLKVDWFKKAEF
jgi:hypothetical protein